MKDYESMTFQEAVKYLADRAGVSLPEVPMGAEEKRKLDQADRMKDMYKEAAVFYYKALFTPAGKNGLDYFTKRGLDREAIKKYGLGYAPSGSYLYKHLRSKGYSDRELDIVKAVAEGLSNKEIAAKLFISEGTVKNYITSILAKENLSHRTALAVYYLTGRK